MSRARSYRGKRLLDLMLAIVLASLVAVPAGLVALAVGAFMGRPILFRHTRVGLAGRPFLLYKFRTMRAAGEAQSDAARITALGRFLRATSLDELPQLFNVLRGDMSLVGPRPLLPEYIDRYTREQARRHEVLPGITGLAQVSGRNGLSWERKFELDCEYVDRHGLALDLEILARTVAVVLLGSGVSARGHATMPEFRGTGPEGPGGRTEPIAGGVES